VRLKHHKIIIGGSPTLRRTRRTLYHVRMQQKRMQLRHRRAQEPPKRMFGMQMRKLGSFKIRYSICLKSGGVTAPR
jgi:hypothetical protein